MTDHQMDQHDTEDRTRRPPRAVVGSYQSEEEIFGKVFDGRVVRRIWRFVRPYRTQVFIAVAAVLTFTLSQIAMPLTIRYAIDHGMAAGGSDRYVLNLAVAGFVLTILVNYAASYVQETVVGRVAESVLFDMRRAMFAHLQRVSLSFMDKTEVGRLMSRLQGDVNSMQEFLETSVLSVGRHRAPVRHHRGAALARPAARCAHPVGDAGAVPGAHLVAAAGARRLHGGA